MAERMTYEPKEIRDAIRYVDEQIVHLLHSHAANWRRRFLSFIDEMTLRFEGLKLLTTLLNGNRNIDPGAWFDAATAGSPPPLPDAPYDAMALVWQQMCASVKKQGEGFFVTSAAIDLPYVLSCGFPGASLGEKYYRWQERFLFPFDGHLRGWLARIGERLPNKSFDLWDLALEVVNAGGPLPPLKGTPPDIAAREREMEEEDRIAAGGSPLAPSKATSKPSNTPASKPPAKAKAKAKATQKQESSPSAKPASKRGDAAASKATPATQKGDKKGRPVTTAKKQKASGASSKKGS